MAACLQAWLGPFKVPTKTNKVVFQVYSKLGGNYLTSVQVERRETWDIRVHPEVGVSYLKTMINKQALEAIAKTASRIMPHTPELSWQSMVVEVDGAKPFVSGTKCFVPATHFVSGTKAFVSWDDDKAKALLKRLHQATYHKASCVLTLVLGKSAKVLPEVAVYKSCTKCVIHGKMAKQGNKKNKAAYVELGALTNMPSLGHLVLNHGNFSIPSLPPKLTDLWINHARVKAWPSTLSGLTELRLDVVDLSALAGTMGTPTLRVLMGVVQEPTLRVLVAHQASLEGTIPSELAGFPSLTRLDLSRNSLTGDIPSYLGELACLKQLDLSGNFLTSNIPSCLGYLACLEALDLSSNCLVGTIPSDLGRAARLVDLFMKDNYLEGTLPSELKHLGLVHVDLSRNQLTGSVPTFRPSIYELDLSFNMFSSLAPDAFSGMFNLTHCKLSNNRLVGNIPSSIGMLVACIHVDLSHNYLASMPSELGLVGSAGLGLSTLLLHDNHFAGSIPHQVFNGRVGVLDVSNNRLSGRLPSEVGLLRNAKTLNLANNRLSGSVPCELGLGRATRVDISGNRFQGKLPKQVSALGRSGKHRGTLVFDEALVYNHADFRNLDLVPKGHDTF